MIFPYFPVKIVLTSMLPRNFPATFQQKQPWSAFFFRFCQVLGGGDAAACDVQQMGRRLLPVLWLLRGYAESGSGKDGRREGQAAWMGKVSQTFGGAPGNAWEEVCKYHVLSFIINYPHHILSYIINYQVLLFIIYHHIWSHIIIDHPIFLRVYFKGVIVLSFFWTLLGASHDGPRWARTILDFGDGDWTKTIWDLLGIPIYGVSLKLGYAMRKKCPLAFLCISLAVVWQHLLITVKCR